jgi:NAD(P)-dependent dehydrogenase (short-subunit alcohol dehydrogenase family)
MAGASRFADRTAIVTGGGRGFGRDIAGGLAAEGADVLIVGRGEEHLRRAVDEIGAAGGSAWHVVADLSEPAACERVVAAAAERWRKIDVLVNNAGVLDEAPFLEIELDRWSYVLALMLQAPFLLSQGVGRLMASAGGGSIVNIASIDGRAADGPYASYSVAKAGLLQLTRNAAVELGPSGIRVNSVSPGWCLTEMLLDASTPEEAEQLRAGFPRAPLKRLVTPSEVADAVLFLASDQASGITATDLVVDGGLTADLYVIPTVAE